MRTEREIRPRRHRWTGAGSPFDWLLKTLVFVVIACVPAWAEGNELTIIVMAMEHERPECERFDRNTYALRFPSLTIDNTESEWRDPELRIGHHCWLCGELNKLAAEAGQRIHLRFVTWEHPLDDLKATYAGRYDVCQVPSTWTAHLIDKGILAPYEALVDPNGYPEGALESCRGPDRRTYYAVPWHLDFRVLYYRDSLTKDPNNDLVEFGSFRECLVRRRKAVHEHPAGWQAPMGLGKTRDWDVLHNTLSWAFSGRILEQRDGVWRAVFHKGFLESEPSDGVSRLLQLRHDNLVHFFRADADGEQEWQVLAEELVNGEVDAVIGGPYMRVRFAKKPNICAAPLPRMVEGCEDTFLGGSHLGLTTAAKGRFNAGLARKVIAHLTSRDAGIALYQNTDAMPARKDAFEQFLTDNPRWEAFGRALKSARPYPSLPQWAEGVEVDVVLGLLHNVVDSIASQRERQDIAAQLNAAALKIDEALNGQSWWDRLLNWFSDHGLSLVLAAVLAAVLVVLMSLRRAVRGSTHTILESMQTSAQNIIARLVGPGPPLPNIALALRPRETRPDQLEIELSGEGVSGQIQAPVDRAASVLLLECMRREMPAYFYTLAARKVLKIDNMRRGVEKVVKDGWDDAIKRACRKLPDATSAGIRSMFAKKKLVSGKKGIFTFKLEEELGDSFSSPIRAAAEHFQKLAATSQASAGGVSPAAVNEMIEICKNEDPGNLSAWRCLLAARALENTSDEFPQPSAEWVGALRRQLLRYLHAFGSYKVFVAGTGAVNTKTATEACNEFAKRASAVVDLLAQWGKLDRGDCSWAAELAAVLPQGAQYDWLATVLEKCDLEDVVCLAALRFSGWWQSHRDMRDWPDGFEDKIKNTGWFNHAQQAALNLSNGSSQDLVDAMLLAAIDEGLRTTEFPWILELDDDRFEQALDWHGDSLTQGLGGLLFAKVSASQQGDLGTQSHIQSSDPGRLDTFAADRPGDSESFDE